MVDVPLHSVSSAAAFLRSLSLWLTEINYPVGRHGCLMHVFTI